jgi:hypothetical protein
MQPPPQPRSSGKAASAAGTSLSSPITNIDISEPFNPDQWTCSICTCINPTRYLACDACGIERPEPVSRRRSVINPSAPYQPRDISSASSHRHSSYGAPPSTRYGSNGLPLSTSSRKREHHPSASSSFSSSTNRPREKESVGWGCPRCGAFMEHKWWTCSACGTMKPSS